MKANQCFVRVDDECFLSFWLYFFPKDIIMYEHDVSIKNNLFFYRITRMFATP